MIVHVNKDPYDVYVGRPSEWGNPYAVGAHGLEKALVLFEVMVKADPYYRERAKVLAGKTLACWCAPKGGVGLYDPTICHAQILARAARGDYDRS